MQVVEHRAAHIAQDVKFQPATVVRGDVVDYHYDGEAQHVEKYEGQKAFGGVVRDEIVDGVFLE